MKYGDDSYQGDGVSHALNSSWGKTLTALIYLGLREARLSDKENENKTSKWSKSLKDDYEKAIAKGVFEAYTLLGQYLPNLHYIDKEWAESKIKAAHSFEKNVFETFMEGYLITGNVYEKLYKLLHESYSKALTIKFKEERIQERLIQHITVGYLRGDEKLGSDSLIDKIIRINNPGSIREIVEFLWHQRDYVIDNPNNTEKVEKEKKQFKERIIEFWDYILELLSKRKSLKEEDKKVLSELAKLGIYLQKIDKRAFEKLSFSAPYVTYDFDSPYFIEYLNNLKDKGDKIQSAKYVGKLFLAMLNGAKELIPDYKWENIVEIVTYLYDVGKQDAEVKKLANEICIFYAEHRNLRLRDLYEVNNALP